MRVPEIERPVASSLHVDARADPVDDRHETINWIWLRWFKLLAEIVEFSVGLSCGVLSAVA
jgi:hypothetical protein